MEAAVEDADLGAPQPPHARAVVDRQPEWAEPEEAADRPDKIADAAEILLQLVRHAVADHRREANRSGFGEIVAIDHAQVDPPQPPGRDRQNVVEGKSVSVSEYL